MPTPSLKGRLWRLPQYDRAFATRLCQAYGLQEAVGSFLAARGIGFDAVESFLTPRIKDHFPDPNALKDMPAAAVALANAIRAGEKIGVLADFDVDGATSAAILTRFLRAAGQADVPLYIPDRLSEGYGANARGMEALKAQGCQWVIIADSGTTAFAALDHATAIGLKTVIVDHHEAEEKLPAATFIVNPKRRDCTSGYTMLAACGVSFLLCVAVNAALRRNGHYGTGKAEPDLRQWLDLVGLGTVCDMVPLTGPNRLFVKAGFAAMALRKNCGIAAILQIANMNQPPEPFHAGFVLGPRINAGSRVHKSDLGAQLLSTDDMEEAIRLAWLLDDCNEKRKSLQKDMLAHAVARVKAYGFDNDPVILLDDPEWHPGLVGLVAGDLKERFGRPACVIAYADSDMGVREGRGSGRSVAGVNIASSFIDARTAGILVKGGGHAMAGGFTVMPDRIKDLRAFLNDHIGRQKLAVPTVQEQAADGVMTVRSMSVDLARVLSAQAAPFGVGNPEPSFILANAVVLHADIVGTSHVRCTIRDVEGGTTVKAVAFKAAETPLGQMLLNDARGGAFPVHLMGSVQVNEWQGRTSAEFHISDAMRAL